MIAQYKDKIMHSLKLSKNVEEGIYFVELLTFLLCKAKHKLVKRRHLQHRLML